MTDGGPAARRARVGRLRLRIQRQVAGAAALAAAASVVVAVGGLLVARRDGFGTFGEFVTLQSVGVLLGIPMLWGVHVNASRLLNDPRATPRPDPGRVLGTSVVLVVAAAVATTAAFLLVLGLAAAVGHRSWLALWPAAPMGASVALLTLVESLTRAQGHQLRASSARLAGALAYLTAVLVVLDHGPLGHPALYSLLVSASNLVATAGLLAAAHDRTWGWRRTVAARLVTQGRLFSVAQALLTLLFGFDLVLLNRFQDAAAVAVYALYVTGGRRLIGVLFSDSLASLLISALSRREPSAGRRLAVRLVLPLLVGAAVGSAVLTLLSLAVAGAWSRLAGDLLLLSAVGLAVHALVIVLFCVITIHPELGLREIRTRLAVLFVPGLVVQGLGAATAGVRGTVAAFAVLNVVLAATMVGRVRRG